MDSKVFSKFNLYDLIGYFLVGAMFLIMILLDLYVVDIIIVAPVFSTQNIVLGIMLSYFLGHVLHAIVKIFYKHDGNNFKVSDNEKRVLNEVKLYFNIPNTVSDFDVYKQCYMLTLAKDMTGQVLKYNAFYAMYRGWVIAFLMESIFLSIVMVSIWFNNLCLIALLSSVVLTLLFYQQGNQYYHFARRKVLQTFILIKKMG